MAWFIVHCHEAVGDHAEILVAFVALNVWTTLYAASEWEHGIVQTFHNQILSNVEYLPPPPLTKKKSGKSSTGQTKDASSEL